MPEAKINAGQLYYELQGEGEPLLLISGLGCDNSAWLSITDELSKSFRIIIFDNRGAGRSIVPEAPYSIRDMADDALQLLDHLSIHSTHVIGHSMGGYIAQEFAINYPERVKKLILEGTATLSSTRNNVLFENFLKWRRDGMGLENWFRAWSFWLFAPQCFEDKIFINTFIQDALQYPYIQSILGFKGQIEAISTFDTRDRLEKIEAKTMVITGNEDILITQKESEILRKGISKNSTSRIDNTAHYIHLEKPKIFNQTVLEFLKLS